ncbi:hypothetical protein O3G_MSEX001200 [Manduca sexta]|uniref:Uncharacterized protein n=1 Tax=Manduca sexta TaxID=7130 RepID=A0A921YJE3_MANSE|nr:hypothetical protein O3G_MSEX001200 [Manduca sexta]
MLSEVKLIESTDRPKIQASLDGQNSHAGLHNCLFTLRLKDPMLYPHVCWQTIPQPDGAAQISITEPFGLRRNGRHHRSVVRQASTRGSRKSEDEIRLNSSSEHHHDTDDRR